MSDCNFIKKIFSREYCKISNNTCFEEHLHTAASGNKKLFLGKVTGHNDHYMINMGGQRPKTGSNWPLIGPYLQCWYTVWNSKKVRAIIFPFILSHFSFIINATNFFPHFLNKSVLKKKKKKKNPAYTLLVFFSWVPYSKYAL